MAERRIQEVMLAKQHYTGTLIQSCLESIRFLMALLKCRVVTKIMNKQLNGIPHCNATNRIQLSLLPKATVAHNNNYKTVYFAQLLHYFSTAVIIHLVIP